jgi:predicted peptidase
MPHLKCWKLVAAVLAVAGLVIGGALAHFAAKPATAVNTGVNTAEGFHDRSFELAGGGLSRYVVYVPPGYDPQRPWPLIVFLHGRGEGGTDGRKQLRVGPAIAIQHDFRERGKPFPFLVLFPQDPKLMWAIGSGAEDILTGALDDIERAYHVDPRRVALTGHSAGGVAVWKLAAKYPDRWAAIAPLCGTVPPELAVSVKHIPCWYFHGTEDAVDSVERARSLIAAMRQAGAQPRYTEFPNLDHGIWTEAYKSQELFDWIAEQRLP